MRKTLAVILVCSQVINAEGQVRQQINKLLAGKDFKKFTQFASSAVKKPSEDWIEYDVIREIIPGYQEAMFTLRKTGPTFMNVVILDSDAKINIITANNNIIYYYFQNDTTFLNSNTLETLHRPAFIFRNDQMMDKLKTQFHQLYDTTLNENDLFIDSIYYGNYCGHTGIPTSEDKYIDSLIKTRNKAGLLQWLQSPNTEKQVYALKGFMLLYYKGLIPNTRELQIINTVRNKKGTMHMCARCNSYREEIGYVITNFKDYIGNKSISAALGK